MLVLPYELTAITGGGKIIMKSDKNSTNYKKESSAYIKNFNNASWLENHRLKPNALFSGDPKLTVPWYIKKKK